jgi:hypothetical protein
VLLLKASRYVVVDSHARFVKDQIISHSQLEEGNLLLHGNTAIFRFAPPATVESPNTLFTSLGENPNARYVLLVDGADEAQYNPDFDWSRYLPTNVPLDRVEHDKCVLNPTFLNRS